MAVTKTTRLNLTRWSANADPWNRADWDDDNASLEANAAMYAQGTFAARPAAAKAGRYYYATDTDALYYDTGGAWKTIRVADSQADLTLGAGLAVAAGAPTPRVYQRAGMASLQFKLTNAAGLASPGHFFTVPAGFRPPTDWPIAVNAGSGWIFVIRASDGKVEAGAAVSTGFNPTGTVTYPVA